MGNSTNQPKKDNRSTVNTQLRLPSSLDKKTSQVQHGITTTGQSTNQSKRDSRSVTHGQHPLPSGSNHSRVHQVQHGTSGGGLMLGSHLDSSSRGSRIVGNSRDPNPHSQSRGASSVQASRHLPIQSRLDQRTSSAARASTVHRTPRDQEFASRQTRIESLPPEERVEQEEWAVNQLCLMSVCPWGFLWHRIRGGYRCDGGGHFISDYHLSLGVFDPRNLVVRI
jgi:hypothetical protein